VSVEQHALPQRTPLALFVRALRADDEQPVGHGGDRFDVLDLGRELARCPRREIGGEHEEAILCLVVADQVPALPREDRRRLAEARERALSLLGFRRAETEEEGRDDRDQEGGNCERGPHGATVKAA
jgi:hypothetical protein